MRVKVYDLTLKQRINLHFKQFKKYCYFAIATTLILLLLLFILKSLFKIHYLISFMIAYFIAASINFILNKYYTFNLFNPKTISRLYYEFSILNAGVFILNLVFLYVLVEFFNIWYFFAQVLISLGFAPVKFFINKKLVFSHR
ncbi:MAG: GtrA family protein [Nanoarchaeota archaeon]|nr:GtrA family protein [Nanoarchaeota archaeon]